VRQIANAAFGSSCAQQVNPTPAAAPSRTGPHQRPIPIGMRSTPPEYLDPPTGNQSAVA
jgi:hypothetical protein